MEGRLRKWVDHIVVIMLASALRSPAPLMSRWSTMSERVDLEGDRAQEYVAKFALANEVSAKRTEDGKRAALMHLNCFCEAKEMTVAKEDGTSRAVRWDECGADLLCSKEFWMEFGGYLATEAVNSRGDLLERDTALQILSGCKETIKKAYRKDSLWLTEDIWYKKLRKSVKKLIERRNNVLGQAHQSKSARIGRNIMVNIGQYYWREGKCGVNLKSKMEAFKKWFMILLTWLAVGRSGEAAGSTWANLTWDYEFECMCLLWTEMKTGTQTELPFVCDASTPEMDVFLNMSAFLIVGGSDNEYLFPDLYQLKTPSSKMTRDLKELISAGVLADLEYSGTSLRVGSVNQLVSHPGISLLDAIFRGGWEFDSIVKIFVYLMKLLDSLLRGARALAGWDCPERGGVSPRFPPLVPEKSVLVENVIVELFNCSSANYERLKPLFWALFSSIVMNFDYLYRTYGPDHVIVAQVMDTTRQFGISLPEIFDWGRLIREDWLDRNFGAKEERDRQGRIDSWLTQIIVNQQEQILALKKENAEIKSTMTEILYWMRSGHACQSLVDSPPSSSRKRLKSRSPSPESENPLVSVNGTQLAQVEAPPQNALSLMSPSRTGAGYTLTSLGGRTIGDMYKDWVKHNLSKGDVNWGTANSAIRSKVRTVMKYMEALLENQEKAFVNGKPNRDDPRYAEWTTNLSQLATTLENRALTQLLVDEAAAGLKESSKGSNLVTGVEGRLNKIKNVGKSKK